MRGGETEAYAENCYSVRQVRFWINIEVDKMSPCRFSASGQIAHFMSHHIGPQRPIHDVPLYLTQPNLPSILLLIACHSLCNEKIAPRPTQTSDCRRTREGKIAFAICSHLKSLKWAVSELEKNLPELRGSRSECPSVLVKAAASLNPKAESKNSENSPHLMKCGKKA